MTLFDSGIRPVIDEHLLELSKEVYPNFNGTVAKYKKLHKWVRKNFSHAKYCDSCLIETAKIYDWASIEDRYTKNREDWEYLCRSCHIKKDGRINHLKKGQGDTPRRGWRHSEATKAKMRENHWSRHKAWKPRERGERGRFI